MNALSLRFAQTLSRLQVWQRDALTLAFSLGVLLLLDQTNLDLATSQLVADRHGFEWQNHWFFASVLHTGGKYLTWALFLAVVVNYFKPVHAFWAIDKPLQRRHLLTWVLCAGVIVQLKHLSATSCPWDLQAFGGSARYLSHWVLSSDGGPGKCFPSGHVIGGFMLLGSFYLLRDRYFAQAKVALYAGLMAGAVMGFTQVMRGAHFVSHVLFTAWLCALIGCLASYCFKAWDLRKT